jgi:hypothetical protein
MKLIEFKEQNIIIAKDQPEYLPLPARRSDDGQVICCWKLSIKERIKLLFTGRVWHIILTFNEPLQPQLLVVNKPQFPKDDSNPNRIK